MKMTTHLKMLTATALSLSLATAPLATVPAFAQSAPSAEAPGNAAWQREFNLWRTVSKAGTASDYETYLKSYPSGKFANVAKKRIDALNTAPVEVATKDVAADKPLVTAEVKRKTDSVETSATDERTRDLEMWRDVAKDGSREAYEDYLAEFPKGKFAKVAQTRLDAMSEDKQTAENTEAEAPVDQAAADDTAADAAPQDTAANQPDETEQTAEAPQESSWEQEYALWKAASTGNTIPEYEAYMSVYPKGKFAAIAQARIVALAAAESPVANIAEGDEQPADDANVANNANRDRQEALPDDQVANADPSLDDQGLNPERERQQAQLTEGSPDIEDAILDRNSRREVQGRLTALGYDTRGVDGSFGRNSRDAISAWQQDNGAMVNGYLSEDQVDMLRNQSEAAYADWLAQQQAVAERPVRRKVVREKVVVEERNHALDAAIAVGVIGAVLGAKKFGKRGGRHNRIFRCNRKRC